MPSGITSKDGMAYVGRKPWHNLGTYVEGIAMTAEDAIDASGLDWTVLALPIYIDQFTDLTEGREKDSVGFRAIEGKKAITRVDTGKVFSVMSDRYTPVQNREAFKFFDAIVGSGEAVYHTAGSLNEGKKVWILAKLQGEYFLDNGEKLESFILLDNSHDGGSSLRMRLSTVRVVCSNTLSLATGRGSAFSTRHTSGIMNRVSQARDLLGLNRVHMDRLMQQCNKIADQEFSKASMTKLVYKLLHLDPDKDLHEQYGSRTREGSRLQSLFEGGVGNVGETRWDAFNAVTEFVDYHKGDRTITIHPSGSSIETDDTNRRLGGTWFSKGRNIRDEAFRILTLPKMDMESEIQYTELSAY